MSQDHKLAVHRGFIRYAGVELESGTVLVTEFGAPQETFALLHQHHGNVEILSLHSEEADAVEKARAIQADLSRLMAEAENAAGGGRLH